MVALEWEHHHIKYDNNMSSKSSSTERNVDGKDSIIIAL